MNPLLTIAILSLVPPGRAPEAPPLELLPMYSVFRMANLARAVVEGVPNGDGTIAVRTRHFVREGDAIPDSLRVHGYGELRRTSRWGEPKEPVAPDTVLLFLQEPDGTGAWRALVTTHDGARGVLWFEGADVWGFGPGAISGELDLGRWTIAGQQQAATPAAVRAQVTAGLAARARFEATLALRDPDRRARALAAYLDPALSPDGRDHGQERVWPDVLQALERTGAPAAPPLARLIQTHPDPDVVGYAAWAVRLLGSQAREAVPATIARLRQPAGAEIVHLIRALGAIGAPEAAAVLRDQVRDPNPFTATEAAMALHRCGGADAAERLADRIPAEVDDRHPVAAVVTMLTALHDLDREAAEHIALERFADYDEILAARDWLRALRK